MSFPFSLASFATLRWALSYLLPPTSGDITSWWSRISSLGVIRQGSTTRVIYMWLSCSIHNCQNKREIFMFIVICIWLNVCYDPILSNFMNFHSLSSSLWWFNWARLIFLHQRFSSIYHPLDHPNWWSMRPWENHTSQCDPLYPLIRFNILFS